MTGKPKSTKRKSASEVRMARIYAENRAWVNENKIEMKGVNLKRGRKKALKNDVLGTYAWDVEKFPFPPSREDVPHTRRVTPKRDAIHKYPKGYSDYRRVLPTSKQVANDSERKFYSELPNRAVMRGKKYGARSGAYRSKSSKPTVVYYRSVHRRHDSGDFVSPKSSFGKSKRY